MATATLRLTCEQSPELVRSMASLAKLAERSPKCVQRFFRSRKSFAKAIRIDEDLLPASVADEMRVVLQPSDRLVQFLAAMGAGDV